MNIMLTQKMGKAGVMGAATPARVKPGPVRPDSNQLLGEMEA